MGNIIFSHSSYHRDNSNNSFLVFYGKGELGIMNMQTLLIIVLVFWGLLLISSIFLFVFLMGKRSVRNNPEKGLVFAKVGLHLEPPIKARLAQSSKKGRLYFYANKQIMIPSEYKEVYYKGKLVIFVNKIGQLVASPFDDDVKIDEAEKESLIYDLVSSKIGSQSIQALQGKSANIIIVAIIAFLIGALAVYGIFKYQDVVNAKSPAAQQKIEDTVGVK